MTTYLQSPEKDLAGILITKKQNLSPLAPIEVEILISRGLAYKIVTESGTMFPKNA